MKIKTILDLSLGDGYVTKPKGKNGNCSIRMNHSRKQKEYVLFKKSFLESVGIRCIYRENQVNGYDTCYVSTEKSKDITEVRNMLYKDGKKVLSKEVLELLDERSMAFLFQDDGSALICKTDSTHRKGCKVKYPVHPFINQLVISMNNFSENCVDLFIEKLKKMGVESRKLFSKGYSVCINKTESKRIFIDLIAPFFCDSMRYKICESLVRRKRI